MFALHPRGTGPNARATCARSSIADDERALIRQDPEAAASNRLLLEAVSARTGYNYGEVRAAARPGGGARAVRGQALFAAGDGGDRAVYRLLLRRAARSRAQWGALYLTR